MTKSPLACGLILTLAACASNPSAPSTAAAAPAGTPGTVATAPAASTAQPPAVSTGQVPATAHTAKPKLICEDSSQLGSHMAQRICLTPEQAEARRKAAQQAAQDAQMRNAQSRSQGQPPI